MRRDVLTFDIDGGEWFFTVALGVAAAIAACGLWTAFRRQDARGRGPGIALAAGGILLAAGAAVATVDRLPFTVLSLKLKLYISSAFSAATFDAAFLIGLAGGLITVEGLRRALRARLGMGWVTTALQLSAGTALAVLLLVLSRGADAERRHPSGTRTGQQVSATRIVDGLEMPTGLAVGPGGELVYVELLKGKLTILGPLPAGGGTRSTTTIDLGLGDGAQAFHVALHPRWPAEPFVYVSAEQEGGGRITMQVLRVRTAGAGEVQPVVTGLPIGQRGESNHYGSAVGFCGDAFFITTGDTDPILTNPDDGIRNLAQSPTGGEGKVLRYRLDGSNLAPDGVAGGNPPVFAMGFRNPFAMTCDLATGLPLVAENGLNSNDQVRLVSPGSNHEWPMSNARDFLSKPVFDTGSMTIAPTGIATRPGTNGNEIILSGFKSTGVYLLVQGADRRAAGKPRLLHEFPRGPLAVAVDERGCVYVADAAGISTLDEEGCR
ncbi:MAG: PQQ-dependent sugar dehydrogenase [Chloroflexi bacterium]|nr:PQQ-dependent sugar dehydrogenase [Chloroflexota bacterium]